jgi:hypothetical protein
MDIMANELLNIQTPDQVTLEMKEAEDRKKVDLQQGEQIISELASHVQTHWMLAQTAKRDIEDRLFRCQRQRNGQYEADEIAMIQAHKSSDIYMQLTNVKCRGAEAWISDALLPSGEKPWGLEPTPQPDLPGEDETEISERMYQEIQSFIEVLGPEAASMIPPEQLEDRMLAIEDEIKEERYKEAKEETRRMEIRLEDELVEGGFYEEFRIFIRHMATFPSAFMKGPVVHAEEQLVWDYETGTIPEVETVYRRRWKTVSPFDIYPSPGARSLQDGTLIQRHRLRRGELYKYIGAPGFDSDAIRTVLREYDEGLIDNWLDTDQERANVEDRPDERIDTQAMIDALEFWGPVQGRKLIEWGMKDTVIKDPDKDYQVTVWKIGRYVVMSRLNSHPLGNRPYYSASFEDNSDSIWGKSPPELMRDCQRICNATARALVNNMGISSGPQVEVFSDRLDASEDAEDIFPWKVWLTKSDEQGSGRPAVHFTQPNINVEPLLIVYDTFFKQASEQSGIPAHVYGSSDIGGAGKTASGLAMLMNAASKTLKDVISHIDDGIIRPVISDLWLHMMLFDSFPKRGDVRVIARASEYLIIAEQIQMRRNEFMLQTNNPVDMAIIGMGGRAELLREAVKGLKMDEKLIPSKETIEQNMLMGGGQPQLQPGGPAQIGAPASPKVKKPNQEGPNEVREMPIQPMEP